MVRELGKIHNIKLAGGLSLAEKGEPSPTTYSDNTKNASVNHDVNKRVEDIAKSITEKTEALIEKVSGLRELKDGESRSQIVNELNTMAKGFGIINNNDDAASYELSARLLPNRDYLKIGFRLNVDSEKYFLTEAGTKLSKKIKAESSSITQKISDTITPFAVRFKNKDSIKVSFEHNYLYTRDETGVLSRKGFEEGLSTGKVRIMYNDGNKNQTVEVFISKIKLK